MPNLLDRAVGAVAPKFALERARARLALDRINQLNEQKSQKFGYDGATTGRRTDGWYAGSADANVELYGTLIWLRDRSRDLVRNNPYAVKAIEELVGNTVGTGIIPQANTGNEALDKIIDKEWPYFVEDCDLPQRMDFYGQQALVVRTMAESGEAIARYIPRKAKSNLRIPLQIQMLESDYLDHNAGAIQTTTNNIVQGVEFDGDGQRIAYWLFGQHPGAQFFLNKGSLLSQRVSADQVLHVFRTLRPGQVRGVPWLAPVMIALRDLDGYCDSERVRKRTESCLAGIVIQEGPEPGLGSITTDGQTQQRIEQFEPGMVAYLRDGQDIRFNNPPAHGGYREYKTSELQTIASGIGVPYEMLASDMSLVNYSSFRGSTLGFRNLIDALRWTCLIPLHCQPIRKRFIDLLVLLGKIPGKLANDATINLYSTDWISPKWESVDPLKDSRAQIERIRSGTETLFQAISANGGDPRKQLEEIQTSNKLLDALGLVLDCDPRYVSLKGVAQIGQAEQDPKIEGKPVPGARTGSNQSSDITDIEEEIRQYERNGSGRSRNFS